MGKTSYINFYSASKCAIYNIVCIALKQNEKTYIRDTWLNSSVIKSQTFKVFVFMRTSIANGIEPAVNMVGDVQRRMQNL
jgi:predicted nucleic acid binding AN1-type Zn finger protein